MNKWVRRSKVITEMAIFTAIGVLLNIVSFPSTGGFLGRITFVYGYCYIIGVIFNPICAFTVACLGDLIPALLLPQGAAWIPLITVSVGLISAIMSISVHYIKLRFIYRYLIAIVVAFIICTLGVNALGETVIFNIYPYTFAKSLGSSLNIESPYLMIALSKLITQPVWIAVNALLAFGVCYRLRGMINTRYNANLDFKVKMPVEI